jgi:hypothetical protein
MRRAVIAAVLSLGVIAAGADAKAEAKTKGHPVSSSLTVDVIGVIDRHGGITYAFGGQISAHFVFACEAQRQVTLFRVEPNGSATPVASANSDFGVFTQTLERPLSEITGQYYAEVAPATRKFKRGRYRKLRCLAARSPTIFVDVPAALLAPPQLKE